MNECITKHRAKHFVCEFCNEHFSDEPCEPSDCEWMNFIDKEPAIDPESLRPTGEWIFKHNPITDPKGYFIRIVCSECNLHTGQKSNYCPNCGAKMKGESDG